MQLNFSEYMHFLTVANTSFLAKPASCELLLKRTSTMRRTPALRRSSKNHCADFLVNPMVDSPSFFLLRSVRILPDSMADTVGLTRNRFRDEFTARSVPSEQIIIGLEFGQQSIHGACVRFQPSVRQNMVDLNAAFVELVPDKQRTVTMKRFLLGAHQRDAVCLSATHDPSQAVAKTGRICKTVVTDPPPVVTARVVGPPAQFTPEKYISDTGRSQRLDKSFPIEMGAEAAVWCRAHVGQGGHAMPS